MIAVMGATGNIGKGVSEQLLARGEQVRALGRSRQKLTGLIEMGAEAAVGEARGPGHEC